MVWGLLTKCLGVCTNISIILICNFLKQLCFFGRESLPKQKQKNNAINVPLNVISNIPNLVSFRCIKILVHRIYLLILSCSGKFILHSPASIMSGIFKDHCQNFWGILNQRTVFSAPCVNFQHLVLLVWVLSINSGKIPKAK